VSSAAFQRRVSFLHGHCCMCRGCVYEQSGLPSLWGNHGTQQVVCLHVAARTAFTFPARRGCVETARMSTSAKDRYSIYGSWDEWQGPTQKLETWQSCHIEDAHILVLQDVSDRVHRHAPRTIQNCVGWSRPRGHSRIFTSCTQVARNLLARWPTRRSFGRCLRRRERGRAAGMALQWR